MIFFVFCFIMILIQEDVIAKCPTSVVRSGRRKDGEKISEIWSKLKVSLDVDFQRPNVIGHRKDGGGKRVPFSKSHGDKRVGKCVWSVSI